MGSFDVSCGVSGVTIHYGDPVTLLCLAENEYGEEALSGAQVVSNDGPMAFYYPCAPLIKGTYADYGRIDVDASCQRRYWTEKEINPAQMVDVMRGDVLNVRYPKDMITGMYIHGDILAALLKFDDAAIETGPVDIVALERLGFTFEEILEVDVGEGLRFNRLYKHPTSGSLEIHSDGNWIQVWEDVGKPRADPVHADVYTPKALAEFWDQATGHSLDLTKISESTSAFSFEQEWRRTEPQRAFLRKNRELKELMEPGWLARGLESTYHLDNFARRMGVVGGLAHSWLTWKELEQYKAEVIELLCLYRICSAVNVLYLPSYCGHQFGDDEMSLRLNETVRKLLVLRECDREEEEAKYG